MAITTKALQDFINATKTQLATIASQLAAITGRLTKAEQMISSIQTTIKVPPAGTPQVPFVYIVSSALASLPSPGNRVAPSDASNMPKIVSSNSSAAIQTNASAHHYRFVGIEVKPAASQFITNLIGIGNGETSLATLPNNITFDRCYIHGDPTVGGRRGVAMNGASIAVIDSYVSGFKEVGADTQALTAWNSPGPVKMVNNYLEAAAENVMFGGSDPTITNLVPSDIEMRRNYVFKPLAWIPLTWSVKNILEFKNAQRILVEGNLFENIWAAGQQGYLLNAKSVNQDGAGTWCIVQDLTFRLNRGKNLENGLQLAGDVQPVALASTRWLFENNELQVANVNGGAGWGIFDLQGVSGRYLTYLTVRHNTVVGIRQAQFHLEWGDVNGIVGTHFDVKDNLFEGVSSFGGFIGRDSTEGTNTLDTRLTNGTVTFNAFQGRNSANYGAASGPGNTMANNLFPATQAAINFVNYAGGNYALNVASPLHNAASDGTDIGADITALNAACLHSADGLWGSEPPTYSGSGTLAELPRTFLNTTYTPQSGATISVNSAATLQAAINSANIGDTIVMDVAGTYTGNFTLPAK